MSVSRPALSALRARIRSLEAPAQVRPVLPFGDERIDGAFPAGGLPLGDLHEISGEGVDTETGAVGASFAAGLLARLASAGHVFWVMLRDDLYGPGLAAFGIDPDRLILVAAKDDAAVLAALEDALRAEGVVAALGEVGGLGLTAGRRLKLACERSGATAFVLHRHPFGAPAARALRREPSAAATRWRITPMPSAPTEPGLGPPRWRTELAYCRGGRAGAWIMEASDASGHVRVVAELADRAAAARPESARAAG